MVDAAAAAEATFVAGRIANERARAAYAPEARRHQGATGARATGITAYLSHGGTLEHAQQIAGHASPKTTKLYDRTADTVTVRRDRANRDLNGSPVQMTAAS